MLLRLIELLPIAERNAIFSELPFCRAFPQLEHPRLAHDPVGVSLLRTVLQSDKGLTLIQGQSDSSVTFVVSAIGHSFALLPENRGKVTGLDVHCPDWFVPVPGIKYLQNLMQTKSIREEADRIWDEFSTASPKLVILNGTWHVPELKHKTRALAENSHVVVTEVSRAKQITAGIVPNPARLITVNQEGRELDRIKVEVQFF